MMQLGAWMFGAAATMIVVIVYIVISYTIGHGIVRGQRWNSNPLALATCAIFAACAIGHGLHLVHVLLPFAGLEVVEGAAHRAIFADWRLLALDAITAGIAIWYMTLRARLPVIYGGAALYEDMAQRHSHARIVHDEVVLGLRRADSLLAEGRSQEAFAQVDKTMDSAKTIITDLLGAGATTPGRLRRGRT